MLARLRASAHWQGSHCDSQGAHFRIWSPASERVHLAIEAPEPRLVEMKAVGRGYHEAHVAGLRPGARYRYRLADGRDYPDPWSRFQPDGPHGASMLCDSGRYEWR